MAWAILAFMEAVAFLPGIMSTAAMPRWALLAVAIPLVSRLDPRSVIAPGRWLMGLSLIGAALSLLRSPVPMEGALSVFFILLLCGVAVAASDLDRLDGVMAGLAWGIGVSSVLCVVQALGYRPVPQQTVEPSGLFWNSLVLAEFAAPVCAWHLIKRQWGMAVMTAPPLLLCHSRIALAMLALALMVSWRPARTWHKAAALVGLGLAAVASVLFLKVFSSGLHLVIWDATALAITPWGQGLGWFAIAHPFEDTAHSDLLQFAAEMGVMALPLFAAPLVILRHSWRTHRVESAVFVACLLQAIVSLPFHLPASAFLGAVLAGFLAADRNRLRAVVDDGAVAYGPSLRQSPARSVLGDDGSRRFRPRLSLRSLFEGDAGVCILQGYGTSLA